MKQCPVCKSMCFDDMEVCFGCMHRFREAPDWSEGYMASGIPEADAQESVEREAAALGESTAGKVPQAFTVPLDGHEYNLTISVQPVASSRERLPGRQVEGGAVDDPVDGRLEASCDPPIARPAHASVEEAQKIEQAILGSALRDEEMELALA